MTTINKGNLSKAMLKPVNGGQDLIFMFNPKELSFSHSVKTANNPGARATQSGRSKVSFSDIPPKKIIIKDIWFDTYETGKDVVEDHLKGFIAAVNFMSEKEQRPPLYQFLWKTAYLDSCFIEQLDYRLTKFLADGTPVRAVIETLGLIETEKSSDNADKKTQPKPDAKNDNRSKYAKK